ncbi:MAG: DegV family protein [Actinobacteria bacterium]|nr:DegV family protein [Actinomycetota bacterium]MBU4450558.1 DegV family protein [Actinomycetota bacterium]MCG2789094.1 DegV family protein [Actinomycetes bacterium]
MEKLAIVTDSSADIPDELIKKYDIKIAPLYIHTRGKEFRDKIDITNNEIVKKIFYTKGTTSNFIGLNPLCHNKKKNHTSN